MEFILEELERENIELETECFSVQDNDRTPHIRSIIQEFQEKKENELAKQKKNSLYTKKEYSKSVSEKVEELLRDIDILENRLGDENELIKRLKKEEIDVIENISLVEREISRISNV
jgi:hypothetical protein